VDKFAGLPWIGDAGAFFAHVDRYDEWGFYGAADPPGAGSRLWNARCLMPPDLIVQDELHLISGPLGTVAALYEVALDRLASWEREGQRIRPKVVASTATVRRASEQVKALFDRKQTAVFPPPGPDRRDSFFAITVPPERKPVRLYVGLASPGRGPKLIFLRALTTLLAAARAEAAAGGDADAYETALCYFNALRELKGARRIVEDEVRARLASYGTERRRLDPADAPFADRRLREPLELTSRVSTDKVAEAKERLARPCADPRGRRGYGAGDQHDLGRARYRPAGADAGAGPAQDRGRVYPGDEPHRPPGEAARARAGAAQRPQAARPAAL
jgi:hypothetical protein